MYFLDLKSLKHRLASGGLNSRDSLIYLLLFIGFIASAAFKGVEFQRALHDQWANRPRAGV